MLECWKANPTSRPSFSDLIVRFEKLLEENDKIVRFYYNVATKNSVTYY